MPDQQMNLLNVSIWGINVSDLGTIALFIIMITMGLTLNPVDFRVIMARPKALVTGLSAQILLLPLVAFALVFIFQPPLPVAIGLIILASCPSGATSNFFSYLAKGDVALSVVLTSISGVIVTFTLPLLVNLGLTLFTGEGQDIFLPILPAMGRIFELIVLPVAIGMAVRHYFSAASVLIEPVFTKLSFAAILFTMAVLFAYIADNFFAMLAMTWRVTVSLNLVMMAAGFFGALVIGIAERQSRSICIEIGVQNYLLSVVVAISLLGRPDFAIVPIIYLFTMYVTVFSFILYCRLLRDRNRSVLEVVTIIRNGLLKANRE